MTFKTFTFALLLFVLCVTPAYAYGDPTGGTLFQILMPTLAAIWGVWIIFANNIRRRVTKLVNKLRGIEPEGSASD